MKGKIKNVNTEKGYGFITGANGVDYFFHQSELQNCGIADLTKGREVEFDDEEGTKGPRAVNVSA